MPEEEWDDVLVLGPLSIRQAATHTPIEFGPTTETRPAIEARGGGRGTACARTTKNVAVFCSMEYQTEANVSEGGGAA